MVSSYGERVTALDYHCRTIVLNQGPFCLSTRLPELARAGAVCLRADFIYRPYDPEGLRHREPYMVDNLIADMDAAGIDKTLQVTPTIMGYDNQPFQGIVRSVGWGIYVQDGSGSDSTGLLPSISQTIDWVRLPQRFPVRLHVLGRSPVAETFRPIWIWRSVASA